MLFNERLRYDCYRFLSACFCQPAGNVLQEENMLGNLTVSLQRICPEAAAFSAVMLGNISKYSSSELLIEYANLFVGPFELKAPPYGSVYLDGERRVMGDSTMEVIRLYEEEGLRGADGFNDLPDHIAVELEFVSFLIYKEIEALEKSDFGTALTIMEKQKKFLDGHLGPWVRRFCGKIKEGTDNRFYTALADCVSCFMSSRCLDGAIQALLRSELNLINNPKGPEMS